MNLRTALSLTVALAGCGGGGGGMTAPDLAAPLTDSEVCNQSCAQLIACGVQFDSTCASGCMLQPIYRACARGALGDCNALALCTFKEYSADVCGGGGYPAGSMSCAATANCEGACNVGNPTYACVCSCTAALDPAKALNSLINAQCAQARCASCHAATFDGAACDSCAAQLCGANPCLSS